MAHSRVCMIKTASISASTRPMGGAPNSTRKIRGGLQEVVTLEVRLVGGVGVGQADEVGKGVPCKKHSSIFQSLEARNVFSTGNY